MIFRDRKDAGQRLAAQLARFRRNPDVVLLGLPRGGVPVAAEVAQELGAPLDVFVVRKLGVPQHEELAFGAIASGGVRVLDAEIVDELAIPDAAVNAVLELEMKELQRRELAYRRGMPAVDVKDRIVILIDDGIATGASIRAAVCRRLRERVKMTHDVPKPRQEVHMQYTTLGRTGLQVSRIAFGTWQLGGD